MINFQDLPREIQDKIELREQMDQTFHRFVESDYSEIFFDTVQQRANPNVEHSLLLSVIGEQGCHAEGTKILTKNGLKNIECVNSNDEVWTRKGWKCVVPVHKGVQEVKKITLQNGFEYGLTKDHVMLTKDGWKSVENLAAGDEFIAGNCVWSSEWNEDSEKASVIGLLLADGCMDKRLVREKYTYKRISKKEYAKKPKEFHEYERKRIRFYNKDDELHEYCDSMLRKYFLAKNVGYYRDIFEGIERTRVLYVCNGVVCDELEKNGMMYGKKSSDVLIPEWILKSDAAMNGFISGYFAADGYIGGGIEIGSCSKKVVEQMAYWLSSKGVVGKISERKVAEHHSRQYRLFLRKKCINEWVKRIRNLTSKKVVESVVREKSWFKYSDDKIKYWWKLKEEGMTYWNISKKEGVSFSVLYRAMTSFKNGTRHKLKSYRDIGLLKIKSIEDCGYAKVYDLQVDDVHEYIANGVLSHNSGKSFSAIAIAKMLDKNFSEEDIYFDYNQLVYNRSKLRPNSVVLVDEQQQSYGLDSHRVMTILASLKEQLRKKSIHFIFCSPVLYPESKSSMYILEVMFIDFETEEAYVALKTRDELTLGHIRVPSPLKNLGNGYTLATKELIEKYQAKKDAHLERVLGNKDVDIFQERANAVMTHPMFKKVEKIYKKKRGYIPQTTLIQIINKIYPEFHAGVVPIEIAGRIKLEKEISGEWDVAGAVKKSDRKDAKSRVSRKRVM